MCAHCLTLCDDPAVPNIALNHAAQLGKKVSLVSVSICLTTQPGDNLSHYTEWAKEIINQSSNLSGLSPRLPVRPSLAIPVFPSLLPCFLWLCNLGLGHLSLQSPWVTCLSSGLPHRGCVGGCCCLPSFKGSPYTLPLSTLMLFTTETATPSDLCSITAHIRFFPG